MAQEKFNPYFNPDLPKSLEQVRLKDAQKNQRSGLINDKYRDAIDAAEKLGIPISFKPIGGRTVVFQKEVEVNQLDRQPERQDPTGQK